jgi:hypothetical protein
MSEEPLNAEMAAFESMLGRLQPQPATVNRDRLMFLSGQAAAARPGARRKLLARYWGPLALAANLLLALTLGILLAAHRSPPAVERIVYVSTNQAAGAASSDAAPASTPRALAAGDDWGPYLKLRQEVLAHGLDALPEAAGGGPGNRETPTPESLRRDVLERLLQG